MYYTENINTEDFDLALVFSRNPTSWKGILPNYCIFSEKESDLESVFDSMVQRQMLLSIASKMDEKPFESLLIIADKVSWFPPVFPDEQSFRAFGELQITVHKSAPGPFRGRDLFKKVWKTVMKESN